MFWMLTWGWWSLGILAVEQEADGEAAALLAVPSRKHQRAGGPVRALQAGSADTGLFGPLT